MLIIPLYSECRAFRKTSAYKTSDWIWHHILLASMPFFRVEILSAYNKTCWVFFTLKWQTEKEITNIKMTTEKTLLKYKFPMETTVILHLKKTCIHLSSYTSYFVQSLVEIRVD